LVLRTHYILFLVLRTHYFHWVYAPVIFIGFTHPLFSLGLCTRYFHWVYAPVIFIGFTHPLSSILGFTHPLFSLGLRTLIFIGFTHPLSSSFGSLHTHYLLFFGGVYTLLLPLVFMYPPFPFLVYRPFISFGTTIHHLFRFTHLSSLFAFTRPFIFCPRFIHPLPSVFSFPHPTSSIGCVYFQLTIGFTTHYLIRDYHPPFIGLRACYFYLVFMHPSSFIWVYALLSSGGFMHPTSNIWFYVPSFRRLGLPLLIYPGSPPSFCWEYRSLFVWFAHPLSFMWVQVYILYLYYIPNFYFGCTHSLPLYLALRTYYLMLIGLHI
jgi:hypothetical protein